MASTSITSCHPRRPTGCRSCSRTRPSGPARSKRRAPPASRSRRLIDKAKTAGVTGFSLDRHHHVADPGEGISDISLLAKAIGMLPKFDMEASLSLDLDFDGLHDGGRDRP